MMRDLAEELEQWENEQPPDCYFWRPRPDQPHRFDQQTAFYESRHPGVTFLVGGNGSGTSEAALAKVAKFVLHDQEAPRPDTPFWIISNSFDQCTKTCWKEKLSPETGHGHIPTEEIDWERVHWYRSKESLPFSVPLKSWANGDKPKNNWVLHFRSYEQGRAQMQAEAIGGFLFVEQFPWGLLTEVVRGCREYGFPGSMLAEFTPVDPSLTYDLQEMMEEDRLPEGWAVYRCNTECALEAGHVSQAWFEQFTGMLTDENRLTRLTGAWASFEGLIYQHFNPLVHFIGDEECFPGGNFPQGVWFRRGLDWGAGPENPFCCLFGYKNGLGEWTIYDEYYSADQQKTVHEHLRDVADMWPWPLRNPYYGVTYADPSDLDNIAIASRFAQYHEGYENFSIQMASNRVLPGIDHVRYMLKHNPATGQPRLRVHRKRCPNLAREIQIYRWLQSSASRLNPRDARPEPLKKDDHAVDALRYLLFSEAHKTGTTIDYIARPEPTARKSIRFQRVGR